MKVLFFVLLSFFSTFSSPAQERIYLGEFGNYRLQGWETKAFHGHTQYGFGIAAGQPALIAESRDSASGLFKTQSVDLTQTPFLNWSWRIERRLSGLNEQSKGGDDYAARIYVLVKGGWAFWQTKAINYVWTGSSPQGSQWPNAYAGRQAMMLAVRDASAPLHTWLTEKRQVREDFKTLFNQDVAAIDAIAIMTDTDDSHGTASSAYGDIWFSKD
ncbi:MULTISPECIES: DUF3047 domain-containing protein [Methylomonas]|uniref:DUF3047 domain-containing protein n=1 Tax=Methylomonas TaxID=416 RepID=UPI0012318AE4|nr:DUF3047 domain-containing protein [Methylomonas rhizoryzae]